MKQSNQYVAAIGRLYPKIPKSVFAAIAFSYANWASGEEAKTTDQAVSRMLDEWRALHENGIVPQKPIAAPSDPLDRACPNCKAAPGMPCSITALAMTPRQFVKTVDGRVHRARARLR